ncbi:hypothetical protein [Virgibacillus sp. SK37]|uniref:hypothetical protein n=1 Tax=Virgibacillus sp. SK37 TaxID=403957 RepID=UPI0006939791|nr:hypothetical protein [Virgibacillus sp. SK37]
MFVLFIVGLVVGLIIHACTYIFTSKWDNRQRAMAVGVSGAALLMVSLTVIGGFAGMPFGVISIGIFSVAILMVIFKNNTLWKKIVYTFIITTVLCYSVFIYLNQTDYWVIKKSQYYQGDEVGTYLQKLQEDPTIEGYKTFTISEGNKSIILSLGEEMAGNDIEVLDVEEQSYTTIVKVKSYYNQSSEKNPVIAIGLDRLKESIVIMDTNGTMYEEVE